MKPQTSQRIYAIKKQNELDRLWDLGKARNEKPRARTVKYAEDGKGVEKGEKVQEGSAKNGRKEQAKALDEYMKRVKEAGKKIPAEKMKKMQEKVKDNNARKYREQINGYYQENVMTPEAYESWQENLYGKNRGGRKK